VRVPIYQVLSPVDYRRGGITRNVLKRAGLLASRFEEPVHILTFDFNPDYDTMRAELVAMQLIDDSVVIHNFFEDLAPRECLGPGAAPSQTVDERPPMRPPASALQARFPLTEDSVVGIRVYAQDGHLLRMHQRDSTGATVRIEHLDEIGRLRRIDTPDASTGQATERYLHADGRPFILLEFDLETGASTRAVLLDLKEPQQALREYPDVADMRVDWLESFASQHETSCFLSDYRNADKLVIRLDGRRVARVKTLHTNHLAEPFVYGSALRPRARTELGNAEFFDALVLLSDQQRDDVMRQFGPRSTYHVVNNPSPPAREMPHVLRNPYKAVGVGRYHDLKRWDYAIRAFRHVVDAVPQATLEIWGFGPAQASLQSIIDGLGLHDSVHLAGMAFDTATVFASAAFSVLSSPAEGFPLVPMESMAVGTPVVAFRANYGLADQVRDGVDGILVDVGDTDALASAMIALFTDRPMCEKMGVAARDIADRLSETAYVDRWVHVLDAAIEQARMRVHIEPPRAQAQAVRFCEGHLQIEGTIALRKSPANLEVALYAKTRNRAPLTDDYYSVEIGDLPAGERAEFTARVPTADLARRFETWDLYISCSARNAHTFSRVAVASAVSCGQCRTGQAVLRPYVTANGNLSVRVSTFRQLAQRLASRVLRTVGAAPATGQAQD